MTSGSFAALLAAWMPSTTFKSTEQGPIVNIEFGSIFKVYDLA